MKILPLCPPMALFTLLLAAPALAGTMPVINVTDFGAWPDDSAADGAAIQAALDAAAASGVRTVHIPRGTYLIEQPLTIGTGGYSIHAALHITGEFPILKAVRPMTAVLSVNVASHLALERLAIDGNGLATYGLSAFKVSGRTSVVSQVEVWGARSHGFLLRACQGSVFRDSSARDNGGDGWHIVGANAAHFEACSAIHNRANGFTVSGYSSGSEAYSGGCVLNGLWSERNGRRGLSLEYAPGLPTYATNGFTVTGGWFEGNAGDAVFVSAWNSSIEGLKITSAGVTDTKAIRLAANARAIRIEGNAFANNGVNSFGTVHVEGSVAWHHVEANYHMFTGALAQTVQGP